MNYTIIELLIVLVFFIILFYDNNNFKNKYKFNNKNYENN